MRRERRRKRKRKRRKRKGKRSSEEVEEHNQNHSLLLVYCSLSSIFSSVIGAFNNFNVTKIQQHTIFDTTYLSSICIL